MEIVAGRGFRDLGGAAVAKPLGHARRGPARHRSAGAHALRRRGCRFAGRWQGAYVMRRRFAGSVFAVANDGYRRKNIGLRST